MGDHVLEAAKKAYASYKGDMRMNDEVKPVVKEVDYEQLNTQTKKKPTIAYLDEKLISQEEHLAKMFQLVADMDNDNRQDIVPAIAAINSKIMRIAWILEKIAPKDKNVQTVLKGLLS